MLKEITNLAENLDIKVIKKKISKIRRISPSTLIGKGLLEQMLIDINLSKINLLICNCILTPAQQKNLENFLKIKVTDRTGIILEIFAKRAASNEGKLQVELAELIYRKSRLVRAWTHLERQRGGTTFIGGPGELQIELDRRLIQNKIINIKKRLKKVRKRRSQQRKSRTKNNFKTFALVGYTNAGKTLLFNKLTKNSQTSRNRLFETLDTKISRVFLEKNINAGLIATQLIESFKATLEEIHTADYLINIVDINDKNSREKIETTKKILRDTGIEEQKISEMLTVFNKIDIRNVSSTSFQDKKYVSALTGTGITELKGSMLNLYNL
jgi:GTP-binding protein HflX